MVSSFLGDLFGEFLGEGAIDAATGSHQLANSQKVILGATAIASYVIARSVFGLAGLPSLPGISSLLLQGQPFYAPIVAIIVLIGLTILARPFVGGIRHDAPLFCAAIGLLALPTHSGDSRNALLDAGSAGVYIKMIVEIAMLAVGLTVAYIALGPTTPLVVTELDPSGPPEEEPVIDTAGDRLAAIGVQTLVVIALLSLLGQSPLKGQAMIAVALAGGLGAWVSFKTRVVRGSVWYVAGTLLAGVIAYAWTYLHPEGLPLGDTRGYLAGAARSLPLHYATAGVAGTIYGYWAGRAGETVSL
ncbi:MAG: hypothetical protein JWM57_1432 [Phycisphaerales bacterium]|nr:hypothetical protein [Phycisphaerales bacterium]